MGQALAISWDDKKGRKAVGALLSLAVVLSAVPLARSAAESISVIVRELPGAGNGPERATQAVGGSVGRHIGIINGFVATVPENRLDALQRASGVYAVTPDVSVHLNHTVDGYNAGSDAGSMYNTVKSVKAQEAWSDGYLGQGVDVALIDSGVVPVNGLSRSNKVINGPDLSFESQAPNLRYLDTFGHGTHMAGIIAGLDDGVSAGVNNHDAFQGVAPRSRILSVKVANALGATDVSQVLAAIDWVVQHKNDNGMNVRVLNLSFGTDGVQSYLLDPLTYAAEVAWQNGIVVVVAGGNAGFGSAKLNNPAYDPYVIAVGASDTKGTYDVADDVVPDWSSSGDGVRNPDLVAPGKSIVGLRNPNSYADLNYPEGRVGTRFFRGSGTSQSTAVVSGAAALLLSKFPNATPDQIKRMLVRTATPLPVADPIAQGAGELDMKEAMRRNLPSAADSLQVFPQATGLGTLEGARGSGHVVDETGQELTGEIDIFGTPWDRQSWSRQSWSRQSWSGGMWMGSVWAGDSWTTDTWNRQSWSGVEWTRQSWSRQSWSRQSWSRQSWSRQSWSGDAWDAQSWSAQSWSRQSWSRQSWSSALWGGGTVALVTAPAPTASAVTSTVSSAVSPSTSPSPAPSTEPSTEPSTAPTVEPSPAPAPTTDAGTGG